jgi:hypothetical protein
VFANILFLALDTVFVIRVDEAGALLPRFGQLQQPSKTFATKSKVCGEKLFPFRIGGARADRSGTHSI